MLSSFDPLVSEWFSTRFGAATEPQLLGWPKIREGHDVLISAPTGSGKTLAAFLQCVDSLVRRARLGRGYRAADHRTTETLSAGTTRGIQSGWAPRCDCQQR